MRKLLILVSAVALVVAFTLPAAAETNFYGDVRVSTGWNSFDADVAGTDTVDNVSWPLDIGNTRFGASFKSDSVGANVEIRPNDASYMRHWYGTWNYGGGTLVVGQTWTPTFAAVGGQNWEGGYAGMYGDMWGSLRAPGIQLWMGGLKIAALTPSQALRHVAVAPALDEWGNPVTKFDGTATGMLPKIEVQYALKAGPAAIKIYGGYNSSEEEVAGPPKQTFDYNSYLIGASANIGFGAGSVGINLYTAKNPKEYGHVGSQAQAATLGATDVNEVDAMGFLVNFAYNFNPMMGIYAGFGQATDELDVPGTSEGTHTLFYVGLPINLAKGVTLTPEVGMMENELDTGAAVTPAPSTTYYGAYWRIAF